MSESGRVLTLVMLALFLAGPPAVSDDSHVEEIRKYRESRVERLQAPEGWLSLIGLFWLDDGENGFGSGSDQAIVLPEGAAPPEAGMLCLDGSEVRLVVGKDVTITLDGEPVGDRVLRDDHEGKPDVLRLGRLSMFVIRRGDRFALRVKDPEAETRREFHGIEYFAIDPAHRVEARLEGFDEPKKVQISSVAGTTSEMLVPGTLVFTLDGTSYRLEPLIGTPEETELRISFWDQKAWLVDGQGRVLVETDVSTGVPGHETPLGRFEVLEKLETKRSNRYGQYVKSRGGRVVVEKAWEHEGPPPDGTVWQGISMPCWMRLTWDGVGMHVGKFPLRSRSSFGCIRVYRKAQPLIFRKTVVGTPVTVVEGSLAGKISGSGSDAPIP